MLDYILSQLDQSHEPGRHALYAAAQVDRQWSFLALNHLWSTINLRQLLSFLGYHNKRFPRCRSCTDASIQLWAERATRFNEFYAHRVRHMFLVFRYSDKLCEHLSTALATIPLFCMTKLHSLTLDIFPFSWNLDFSQRFLQPTLVKLDCSIYKRLGMPTKSYSEAILEIIAVLKAVHCLSYFRLRVSLPPETTSQTFVDAFKDLNNLKEVDLSPYLLSPPLISALSTLPSLSKISCVFYPQSGPRRGKFLPAYRPLGGQFNSLTSPLPANHCSNITQVSLRTPLETVSKLFSEGFNPDILVSINMMLRNLAEPSQLQSFARHISMQYIHLRQLRIAAPEIKQSSSTHNNAPRMPWSRLRSLLGCLQMQDFEIFWHTPIIIADEDIAEIANSWSNLRRLVLEDADLQSVEEEIVLTFDCLTPLSRNCLDLRELSLHLSPLFPVDADIKVVDIRSHQSRIQTAMFPNMRDVTFHLGIPLPSAHDAAPKIASLINEAFLTSCVIVCPYLGIDLLDLCEVPPPASEETAWQVRQMAILKFWKSVVQALPEGACTVQMTDDYEPVTQ